MIRHIVLTKFRSDVTEETVANIYSGLADVAEMLPGASGFTGGRSQSPEQIERGYMHGFVIDFDDWDALATYTENAEHKALGAQLVELGPVAGNLLLGVADLASHHANSDL